MSQPTAFAEVLDAAEQLDAEAQAELIAVLSRRLAERGRARVATTVAEARREFAAGHSEAMTPADLIREASLPLSEAKRRELDRRIADQVANPDDGMPWEEVEAEALARFRRG